MYEILAGMDALITDYSSVAFDASVTRTFVLIYADDTETYANDRDKFIVRVV